MADSQEIVQEFLVESYENLDRLDREFIALEKDPQNREMLSGIFRTIHTIKGTCGFLGFSKLEKVAHVGETLLSRMRDGKILLDGDRTTALLQMVDAVREILSHIETAQSEGDAEYLELIERLTQLSAANSASAAAAAPAAPVAVAPAVEVQARAKPLDPLDALLEEEMKKSNAALIAYAQGQAPAPAAEVVAGPVAAKSATGEAPVENAEAKSGGVAENNVRVDVTLLDRLMNLVGELVLSRNQVLMCSSRMKDANLIGTSQRLNLITSELQEAVIKTRMQPIGNVWNKLPRVVRDLSRACGKQVRVEMDGQETELDKTVLEAIKDPLTHIVRNSVDHGIESPEVRALSGKPEQGCLKLRAYHEGGQVNIEIIDDGAGVRIDKVKKKAIGQGLITTEQAAKMSDREATMLLFRPGFSTAEKITNVSGRGVGMDVVKTNIEKIGGTVDLHSVPGEGTKLLIKIPLTLAIIPALVISSGNDRFAIPQVSLLELVRLEGPEALKKIECIRQTQVYRLRGQLLPLVYLNDVLKLKSGLPAGNAVNIVVLQSNEGRFGLVVDRINDATEIVVKPLSKLFKGLTVFSGATVMGDGQVTLILDVPGLAHAAHLNTESKTRQAQSDEDQSSVAATHTDSIVIFSTPANPRMAVDLSKVARLEEIPRDLVEFSGGQQVVQYRGKIMPLIHLDKVLGSATGQGGPEDSGDLQVIVHRRGEESFGLVVGKICDIVNEQVQLQRGSSRFGITGSAVIAQRVTEFVDLEAIVASVSATASKAPSEGELQHV